MIAKLAVVTAVLAVSEAVPMWLGNPYASNTFFRNIEPPSIAYGFGSGFSSNIGGIRHSTGYGTSFQTGDAQAYGGGFGSTDRNTIARGVGYAQAFPQQQQYRNYFPQNPLSFQQANAATFNSGLGRTFGSAVAQSFGDFGSAVSSVQTDDGIGSAVSAVQNNGRFQSAVSSVQNLGRNFGGNVATASNQGSGFGTVLSRADNSGDFQTAISSSQGQNGQATSIAQNIGGYRTSIANNVQQRGGLQQNNGASVINGPGFQAAHSHSINSGYY